MSALQINSLEQVPHGLTVLLQMVEDMRKAVYGPASPAPTATTNTPAGDELLSRQEAADALRVSLPTLNELTKSGKIQGYRIGNRLRYKRDEIHAALSPVKTSPLLQQATAHGLRA